MRLAPLTLIKTPALNVNTVTWLDSTSPLGQTELALRISVYLGFRTMIWTLAHHALPVPPQATTLVLALLALAPILCVLALKARLMPTMTPRPFASLVSIEEIMYQLLVQETALLLSLAVPLAMQIMTMRHPHHVIDAMCLDTIYPLLQMEPAPTRLSDVALVSLIMTITLLPHVCHVQLQASFSRSQVMVFAISTDGSVGKDMLITTTTPKQNV